MGSTDWAWERRAAAIKDFRKLGWVGVVLGVRAEGVEWKSCGRRVVMMVERWLWVVVMACVATGAAAATTQPARLGVGDHWCAVGGGWVEAVVPGACAARL